MGGLTQDFIEVVRNEGDIVRLVSDYVPLKKAGSRLKGLCPFHQEKTPSFSVDPERQLFYCFGCQTGGDIFKFVQLYERAAFPEAVELVAKRFAIPMPAAEGKPSGPRERTLELNRLAAGYYGSVLSDPDGGRRCRAYLEQRGIDEKTAARLELGYAPDGWQALVDRARSSGFKPEELLRGGLAMERKSGRGQYDRFRNRLIFPIRDVGGRSIAFGGRALGDDEPKYINSPETPAYTKGNHLYGLDLARDAVRREGAAIVVEGYMDVAALLQAGFEHVVASLGTAFTGAQARVLARYTKKVVISYDGDAAGASATARSVGLLLDQGFEVRVVVLPGGMDPDDFIKQEGAEAYGRLLEQAPDYLQFLVDREAARRDLDRVEEKVAAVNAVLPHIAKLNSAIERASWVTRLADTLLIEEDLILQELRAALASARTQIRVRPESARIPGHAETRLVSLLLRSEDERQRCADELGPEDLHGTAVARIVQNILHMSAEGKPIDYPHVLEALEGEADRDLFTRIAFQDEPTEGPDVDDCLCAFRRQRLAREKRAVLRQIGATQQASSAAAAVDIDQQLARMQQLARQRDGLT